MDFFEHQDAARRKTGRLVALFVIAVALIVLLVYVVAIIAYSIVQWQVLETSAPPSSTFSWWDPRVLALTCAGTLVVIVSASLYKITQLRRGGGAVVAVQLGGRPIARTTDDPLERRLLNVVDEMAIASGLPSPPVYVLDREKSINAFAAGYEPSGAVIGITRGAMERLSRDELQGVIAHEFSHILSGDMRLNIRILGLLHGILIISILGYTLLRSMAYRPVRVSRDNNGAGLIPLLVVGAGLVIVGSIGAFFGAMIKAAVSRQREYLADASAVQFTRNPSGIADALRKIGGVSVGARINAPSASEASHMFFGQALTSGFSALFATHPPLRVRIRRIDPRWDGKMLASEARRTSDPETIEGLKSFAGAAQATLLEQIGDPTPAHIQLARERLAALPPMLHAAAQEPFAARALVLGLLLSDSPAVREHQLGMVAAADRRLAHELHRLARPVRELSRELRLTIVDLALPALTSMTPGQEATFVELTRAVIGSDDRIDLFEFCIERIVISKLDAHRRLATRSTIHYYAFGRLADECAVLLSALARAGSTDQAKVAAAFEAGATKLGEGSLTLASPRAITLSSLENVFEKLNHTAPKLKKRLIEACAAVVSHDHIVTPREGEFLRAIADSIDVPAPPLLPGQRLA
jgi:Zn-dependent protease with chaperone function